MLEAKLSKHLTTFTPAVMISNINSLFFEYLSSIFSLLQYHINMLMYM